MESLLGRHKKSSRLIALSKLAISRIAVLKNQRRVRSSVARSDVIQLLHLGHQDRALLRAELVIKEQNMFDALSMIEGYCNILSESIRHLEKNNMEVSDELKEAMASLMFAAPRCGEFPELREICRIIWKEFTASALQIHNNSKYSTGVISPKIIRKLTLARQPSSGSRLMALKEIASENGIQLLQYTHELNSEDIESETNEMVNEEYESAHDEDDENDNEDAVEESLTNSSAAAFGSSRSSDLEKRDHHINATNDDDDILDQVSKLDSLGSKTRRRHLSRQYGRVLERKQRNINNIATQESNNNVITYTGVAVGSDC